MRQKKRYIETNKNTKEIYYGNGKVVQIFLSNPKLNQQVSICKDCYALNKHDGDQKKILKKLKKNLKL